MRELGDYHHMDERVLRTYQTNLDAPGVQKTYKVIRETFEKAQMKGQMPGPTLLIIAADYQRHFEKTEAARASLTPKVNAPPGVDIPQLVEAVDGGKHSDDDVF